MKTSPQEAFAKYEEEDNMKESVPATKEQKTPNRTGNRTASDVMEDISTMLADLTNELDSMLSHDSS